MFLDAARSLASNFTDEELAGGSLFPRLGRTGETSADVACAVIRRAVQQGFADKRQLLNLAQRVRDAMWFPDHLPIQPD